MSIPDYRPPNPRKLKRHEKVTQKLSGTESAILNRESSDSESCDSNRAISKVALSIDKDAIQIAILNRVSAILRYCDSIRFFASRCRISGDSRPAILGIVRFAIRDSVPLSSEVTFGLPAKVSKVT